MDAFTLTEIQPSEIRSLDLRGEAEKAFFGAEDGHVEDINPTDPRWQSTAAAFRVIIDGQAETAEALVVNESQRIGIAWGAEASWGDLATADGIEAAIADWLTDEEAWEARR